MGTGPIAEMCRFELYFNPGQSKTSKHCTIQNFTYRHQNAIDLYKQDNHQHTYRCVAGYSLDAYKH